MSAKLRRLTRCADGQWRTMHISKLSNSIDPYDGAHGFIYSGRIRIYGDLRREERTLAHIVKYRFYGTGKYAHLVDELEWDELTD